MQKGVTNKCYNTDMVLILYNIFLEFIFTKYMLIYFLREKLLLWNNTGKTALHIGVKESFNTQANSH